MNTEIKETEENPANVQALGIEPNQITDGFAPDIYSALARAQAEIKNPEKTKTGKVFGTSKSGKKYDYEFKYADIGDVLQCVLPILSKHGISVTQPTVIRDGNIILITRLHFYDEVIESEYPVCQANGTHQQMGSAMTYARRYALTSLIGVAAVEDMDGEGAAEVGDGSPVKMSSHQAKTEINWPEVEKSIDECKTFNQLDKRAERVEENRNTWPETYYWKAKERITYNRLQLADNQMAGASDIDELSNVFADIEVFLDKKVEWDEIEGLYKKHEQRIHP